MWDAYKICHKPYFSGCKGCKLDDDDKRFRICPNCVNQGRLKEAKEIGMKDFLSKHETVSLHSKPKMKRIYHYKAEI